MKLRFHLADTHQAAVPPIPRFTHLPKEKCRDSTSTSIQPCTKRTHHVPQPRMSKSSAGSGHMPRQDGPVPQLRNQHSRAFVS